MALKVAHLFVKYPHAYQPYNVQLIKRQQEAGIHCTAYSFTTGYKSNQAVDLHFNITNKVLFIIQSLANLSQLVDFVKNSRVSLLNAILLVGRFCAIARYKPTIIHIHHIQLLNEHLIRLLQQFKFKWIVSLRGYDISIRPLLSAQDRLQTIYILTHAHGIHAVSEDLRQRAIQLGIDPEKIFVIRRAVEKITPIPRNLSYQTSEIHVATIGRFNWVKGLVFLLQAMKLLREMKFNAYLHICGDGDANERSEVHYWISLLQLEDRVILHGFLSSDDINELLAKTHVYVQPSINEGIPNTLIRAIANKIPVVASRVGGIPEVVQDEVNGILVNPGSPNEIAEAVARIWTDKTLIEKIVNAPMPSVSFDPINEINEYKVFYNKIMTRQIL